MKNFTQRAVTGLTFAGVMVASILLSQWSFIAVFFLILTFGLFEFYKLVESPSIKPQIISGIILSQLLFIIMCFGMMNFVSLNWLLISIPLTACIFITELYRNKENPFLNIAITLSGIIYLTLPVLLILFIAFGFTPESSINYHGEIIMGSIFILWAADTGAYMIGSKFGKHRLFERISPKKSWEGFFGGLFTSILIAWVNSIWFPGLSLTEWMSVTIIIVITGALGDLVESMLKRSIGVKDSGTFFPGHGGILDRFDGLFISIPFVFFYLAIIEKIDLI